MEINSVHVKLKRIEVLGQHGTRFWNITKRKKLSSKMRDTFITMEIDIGIAHRLGHGIFFVWHAVKYVVGQTNVSAFTQIMF